jgi:RimJ/RimL family protein N-acetyltransferase
MYVQPEYRGKGVCQLILGALLQWAKSNGLLEVRLEVYPENLAAVRAYENFGFTPYLLEMRLPPAKE